MRTAVIAKIRQVPMVVRRAVANVGVETVLTLAFVAKLAAGTSLAHGVATIVGDEVAGGGGSVVVFPEETRAEAAAVRAAVRRADVVAVRAGARAARAAARARAVGVGVDSMVRVTVVGPGGVVESRLLMVRRR